MRKPTLLILALIFLVCKKSPGQADKKGALPPANLLYGVKLSRILDSYYSWNTDHPPDHINALHNFDVHNSSLRLNMAEAGLSRDPDPIGFEIDGGVGDTY
jgi:hypothetical protein